MPELVRTARGVVAGEVSDDGTYTKKVRRSAHLYRRLNAWALDINILDLYPIHTVVVEDADDGIRYTASKTMILSEGQFINHGAGPQIALPRPKWSQSPMQNFQMPLDSRATHGGR